MSFFKKSLTLQFIMEKLNEFIKKNKLLTFLFILAIVYTINIVPGKFLKRPQSVHMWAMCDRASVARNYAQESMNFFLPRTNMTKDTDGITGLEFPLMNYSAAICYKIFGFNEIWYRLLMFLLVTAGIVASFKISLKFLNNSLLAFIPPLVLTSSPILIYYLPSFIPDAASLGCILIAWYFFLKDSKEQSWKNKFLVFILITLGCLMKITSLISVIVMITLLVADYFKILSKDSKVFNKHIAMCALLVLGGGITLSWYRYAAWLNETYNAGVFLMQTMRPHSWEEIVNTLTRIKEIWVDFYFYKPLLWLICISLLGMIFFAKKLNRILALITLGLWLGALGFFYIMMIQFMNHDYYILTLLPAVFFQMLTITECLQRNYSNTVIGKVLVSATVVLLVLSLQFNREHQQFRNQEDCWLNAWSQYKDYFDVEPYIQSLGINRHEKVLSICDYSPNISLYFLNLKGWSVPHEISDNDLTDVLSHHPSYVITNDSTQINRPVLQNAVTSLFGKHGSILIYKVK